MSDARSFSPPKRILVATDFGMAAATAARYARLWGDLFGVPLSLVHAQHMEFPPYFRQEQVKTILREAGRARAQARSHAVQWMRRVGGGPSKILLLEEPPIASILRAVQAEKAGLTFMGTHGRTGTRRLWMGSVAEGVVRAAPGPVMVVGPRARIGLPRIILCVVGEDGAGLGALAYAAGLARSAGAKLLSLRLGWPLKSPMRAASLHADLGPVESIPVNGESAQGVLKIEKERDVDLIVMETERRPSFLRTVFGTAAEKVMHGAEVPFLAVPEPLKKESRRNG